MYIYKLQYTVVQRKTLGPGKSVCTSSERRLGGDGAKHIKVYVILSDQKTTEVFFSTPTFIQCKSPFGAS